MTTVIATSASSGQQPADSGRVNLLGLSREGLQEFFVGLGEKPFRARQLMGWMYRFGVDDFAQMTDISKALRDKLPH